MNHYSRAEQNRGGQCLRAFVRLCNCAFVHATCIDSAHSFGTLVNAWTLLLTLATTAGKPRNTESHAVVLVLSKMHTLVKRYEIVTLAPCRVCQRVVIIR